MNVIGDITYVTDIHTSIATLYKSLPKALHQYCMLCWMSCDHPFHCFICCSIYLFSLQSYLQRAIPIVSALDSVSYCMVSMFV